MMHKDKASKGADVYAEHSIVVLLHPLVTDDGVLPAGTRGLIVARKKHPLSGVCIYAQRLFCCLEQPKNSGINEIELDERTLIDGVMA